MWGPEEALILTVIETLAPKTTPEDVYREDGTQDLAERKKQNSTQDFENEGIRYRGRTTIQGKEETRLDEIFKTNKNTLTGENYRGQLDDF